MNGEVFAGVRVRGEKMLIPATGVALLLAMSCGRQPAPDHGEEEIEAPASREVRLSEEAMRAAGIEVVPVSREAFHPHILASGVIRPEANRSVQVRALAAGRVVRVLADVGEPVTAGETLAVLEAPEVTAARARHRTAAARWEAARQALERAENLLGLKAISRAEVELRRAEAEAAAAEAGAAGQDLARLGLDPVETTSAPGGSASFPVRAPMAGTVLARAVSAGLLVERDAPLFEIADLSRVWAVVDVYQKDLGEIQEQGEVEVRTEARPGAVLRGTIALVEPALDEASRTAHVRVLLDNRSGELRPGLFVTVAVPLRGASEVEAVAVPDGAVQRISGLPAVFVETGPGRFELRSVEIGREAHGMVEIRRGLAEGEKVVTAGGFVLKSELLKGTIGGEEH